MSINIDKRADRQMSVPAFKKRKGGAPLVCLTAYTAHVARLIDAYADLILVGDSLGMVIHGMPDTLSVTLDHMIMHGQAVMRGTKQALVVIDMPFGSFEESPEIAFRNAARVIKKTGCMAVKLEGGVEMAATVRYLTARAIPIMGHIGLMPQQLNMIGGFKAVRHLELFERVIEDARAIEAAGAFAIVVEGVAENLADKITNTISIPTIGIGASRQCDGQILVFEDMVGLFPRVPTFVKRYAAMQDMIKAAVGQYANEVRTRKFPSQKHVYSEKK